MQPGAPLDDAVGAVGMLFMLFLIAASAVEMILETFRGALERLGLPALKSPMSLDEAISVSTEFLPAGCEARGVVEALRAFADQHGGIVARKRQEIAAVGADLETLAGQDLSVAAVARINALTLSVRAAIRKNELRRIFVLRLLSIGVALVLCAAARFDAVAMVAVSFPGVSGALDTLAAARPIFGPDLGWGWVLTSLAAASGSAYWHDQLDRVRAFKNLRAAAADKA